MKVRIIGVFSVLALSVLLAGCGGGGTIDAGMPPEVDQAQIDAEFRNMMSEQGDQMEKNAAKALQQ